jgi:hypothetical protein
VRLLDGFLIERTFAERTDMPEPKMTMPPLEGELYIVRNGRLQHIERFHDLPKVEVSESAKEALRAMQRRCRRLLGGFRPDIALVASALIEHAAALPQATEIVEAYARELRIEMVEPRDASQDASS